MNKYQQLLDILNEPVLTMDATNNERLALVEVLKEFGKEVRRSPQVTNEIAYKIAGLLATDYARSLKHGDPLTDILFLAGELEIAPENSDDLREELMQKISKL